MIEELILKSKICKLLNEDSTDLIYPLFSKNNFFKPGYRTIDQWDEVSDISIITYIQNLTQIPYPNFSLEASDSEKELFLLNLQWTSERIHLNLYLDIEGDRTLLEMVSLLCTKPYPYAKLPLGNHSLAFNSMLFVGIENVGYGLIIGDDKVVITAERVSHVFVERISEGKEFTSVISLTPRLIIPENNDRQGFTVYNSSDSHIYVDIKSSLTLEYFMIKIPPMGYWESPYIIKSNIYMMSDKENSIIQIREFS